MSTNDLMIADRVKSALIKEGAIQSEMALRQWAIGRALDVHGIGVGDPEAVIKTAENIRAYLESDRVGSPLSTVLAGIRKDLQEQEGDPQ